ncbi:MAG TPA: 6-carboxytetrahydropterin synthase [Tepidisphaeraceae bacterium]|nr:6-carboxytetrahydropterin synthase [Tepidisphaeraceae bacterium]
MLRLTRQVRFAINATPDDQRSHAPANSHAGYPALTGLGYHFALDVTLVGEPDPKSQYLRNIKDIDTVVRDRGIDIVERHVARGTFGGGGRVVAELFTKMADAWPGSRLASIELSLSPFLSLCAAAPELHMVRLSQRFEFSATHRLHNPTLSDDDNRRTFGKCNNPLGHGHNYEVQVTVAAEPDAAGKVVDVTAMQRTVAQHVIDRFDHKNLNAEVPEFASTIPSVENIAKAAYGLLKPHFATPVKLVSVTIWETPKTWCEYSE